MKTFKARVVALNCDARDDLGKRPCERIEVDFNGVVGDRHAGPARTAYSGDREPKGTVLRNDRQWSGVSVEELAEIAERLDLAEPLQSGTLGANLCVEGIPDFSLLPRGSRLSFPSGAALVVEEYNPPCLDMGAQIAAIHRTKSGQSLTNSQWLKPAAGRRGVVGVVDVPGTISLHDEITVKLFEPPKIRRY